MTTGRDPADRVLDALVAVPVSSLVFTRRLVPVLARAGSRGARRLIERAVGQPVELAVPAPGRAEPPGSAEPAPTETEVEPADAGSLPIDGYDLLAARQVCDRLASLTSAELERIAEYERAHRGRRTVLGKIEQLSA